MRRSALLTALVVVLCALFAQTAAAAETKTLREPAPTWLTQDLRAQIHAAGPEGVQVAEEYLNAECPGYQAPGVSANGCIVAPYGCTANFIWDDPNADWQTQPYIGTASHCTDNNGDRVIMQVDTTTLAEVGTVVRQTAGEEPGDDFALIKIYPEVAAKWGVQPAIPTGGPQGIYAGCDPQVVKNYGHGYGVAVGQGKPEAGLATTWYSDGYGWFGVGIMGDSGSGITIQDNRSAGNFTHIILADLRGIYTPGELAGMRTTKILEFLGAGWSQVNADRTLSTSGPAPCPDSGYSDGGGGSGGGSGKPDKGGGKPSGKGGKGGGRKTA